MRNEKRAMPAAHEDDEPGLGLFAPEGLGAATLQPLRSSTSKKTTSTTVTNNSVVSPSSSDLEGATTSSSAATTTTTTNNTNTTTTTSTVQTAPAPAPVPVPAPAPVPVPAPAPQPEVVAPASDSAGAGAATQKLCNQLGAVFDILDKDQAGMVPRLDLRKGVDAYIPKNPICQSFSDKVRSGVGRQYRWLAVVAWHARCGVLCSQRGCTYACRMAPGESAPLMLHLPCAPHAAPPLCLPCCTPCQVRAIDGMIVEKDEYTSLLKAWL